MTKKSSPYQRRSSFLVVSDNTGICERIVDTMPPIMLFTPFGLGAIYGAAAEKTLRHMSGRQHQPVKLEVIRNSSLRLLN